MCNPDEPPTVCALVEQRNNALDELAVAEGARRTEVARREAERIYWKQYVNGLPNTLELKEHIEKVCNVKSVQIDPIAKLCTWWDTNYVPHPVRGAK